MLVVNHRAAAMSTSSFSVVTRFYTGLACRRDTDVRSECSTGRR
jgi:hypothetical protein